MLGRVRQHKMKELTQDVRDERQEIAEYLHDRVKPQTVHDRYVFLDASTIVGIARSGKVWTSEQLVGPKAIVIEDPKLNQGPVFLGYYAAVNGRFGPMCIRFTSNTTGLKHPECQASPLAFKGCRQCGRRLPRGSSHGTWRRL